MHADIYTGFPTNTGLLVGRICNIRKSIQTCSLNIQHVLKDKVPGKNCKFYFVRQLDYITRINIRWDIYIVLQSLQDTGQETMDQGSKSAKELVNHLKCVYPMILRTKSRFIQLFTN